MIFHCFKSLLYITVAASVAPPLPHSDGDLRLVEGTDTTNGILEVFHNGVWGRICHQNFTVVEANVVCAQLGFVNACKFHRLDSPADIPDKSNRSSLVKAASSVPTVFDAESAGETIFLDHLTCVGNETKLIDCETMGFGDEGCGYVGVTCLPNMAPPVDGSLRVCPLHGILPQEGDVCLFGGTDDTNGRVEVFHGSEWGSVCDRNFGIEEARVICNQLGLNSSVVEYYPNYGGGSGTIWLDDVHCSGNEARFVDCSSSGFGIHNCEHTEDVGVTCIGRPIAPTKNCTLLGRDPEEGDVCLFDGTDETNGRVELFHEGQWGTVCDDNFDLVDAAVVCKQLELPSSGATVVTDYGGSSGNKGEIWLDNVQCTGNEARLVDCLSNGYATHNCVHTQDVVIVCQGNTINTESSIQVLSGSPCKNASDVGICVHQESCTLNGGTIIPHICADQALQCCVGSDASLEFIVNEYPCIEYNFSDTMSLLGNGEKNYDVVKIKKEQLIDPTFYDSSPSEKDNTMTVEVACAFDSMSMAAQEDGIDLKVTSGFRTFERQKYFWDCYQNCSCNNCSPAAQPGRSNHGYGYALDLNTDCDDSPNSPLSSCSSSLVYQWLQLNAAAFGFENTIISEPWHWVFGSRDNNN